MKQETINGITRLTAAPGKVLTNGGSVGTEVWLAPTDKPENWAEQDENADPLDEIDALLDRLDAL